MMYYCKFGTLRTGGTSWETQTKVTAGNLPDKLLTPATEAEGGGGRQCAITSPQTNGKSRTVMCVFVIGCRLNVKANVAAY